MGHKTRFLPHALVLLISLVSTASHAETLAERIQQSCDSCAMRMASETGLYVLEKGEESLVGRAWLAQNATRSIDIQYFIWSTDNVGILAAQQLLRAAERGVAVRVLVDDLLIDAQDKTLLLLSAHPKVQIRIYNPNLTVGVSLWQRVKNVFTDFRAVNQRMHDKTAIFDGLVGITGGRNMADEYFDFDHDYNFRDRDILVLGAAAGQMQENFDEFWASELAIPVENIFTEQQREISPEAVEQRTRELHAYADDPANFAPEVREAIQAIDGTFPQIVAGLTWDRASFISDVPGKNQGTQGLGGSGESTNQLIDAVRNARHSVLIQSPYLIMPEGGIELLHSLVQRGVRVRISTNSLASTDNIPAFGGYMRQREDLLDAGIEVYEYKAHPAIKDELIENYPRIACNDPVFALHAKSMVVDDELLFIGTFNLDPRSANLNTEVGILVKNPELAGQVTRSIQRDLHPDNSWRTTGMYNPDEVVENGKWLKAWFNSLLPMEPIL